MSLKPFDFFEPQAAVGVAWHSQVAARREAYCAHLWAVRNAASLKLLREKAAVKYVKPFLDKGSVVLACKRVLGDEKQLFRRDSASERMKNKEVLK